MIEDTQRRLSDEVIEPLLLDIVSDRELNAMLQKHSALDRVKIEIKISQPEKELFLLTRVKFNAPCPCHQHSTPTCIHSVDASGNAICG